MERGEVRDQGSSPKSLSIKITSITGTSFDLDVKSSDSIQHIKDRIFNNLKISPDNQKLTFKEKPLDRGTLEDYGIDDGCTITLSPAIKSGTSSLNKRSLNIDQKNITDLLRSLPQEYLAMMFNQKRPVTISVKFGDHQIVFTLVPSEFSEHSPSPSPPTSPVTSSPPAIDSSLQPSLKPPTQVSLVSGQPTQNEEEFCSLKDQRHFLKNKISHKRKIGEVDLPENHTPLDKIQNFSKKPKREVKTEEEERYPITPKKKKMQRKLAFQTDSINHNGDIETETTNQTIPKYEQELLGGSNQKIGMPVQDTTISSPPAQPLKCHRCSKKINSVMSYKCKCGHTFCPDHRFQNLPHVVSDKGHKCDFDYKARGKEEIETSNPLISQPKIQQI